MNKLLKTEAMKRLTKSVRNKRGTTLIEMIATVAILAIIASLSFEAMFMAAEEFRRVESISTAERSIALFQENLNLYTKNATKIEFVDNHDKTYGAGTNIDHILQTYIMKRGMGGLPPLQDAESNPSHEYIDIFVYRSDDFTYKIGKYTIGHDTPVTILELENIKEVNFSLRKLSSSFSNLSKSSYLFDYAVVSPTKFEMTYSDKFSVESGEVIDKTKYSDKEGSYSVMTGTVLNNIEDIPTTTLKISENLNGVASAGNYKGDFNFLVIRTVPREAK